MKTKLIEADAEAAETIKTSKRERAKVIINLQEDLKYIQIFQQCLNWVFKGCKEPARKPRGAAAVRQNPRKISPKWEDG